MGAKLALQDLLSTQLVASAASPTSCPLLREPAVEQQAGIAVRGISGLCTVLDRLDGRFRKRDRQRRLGYYLRSQVSRGFHLFAIGDDMGNESPLVCLLSSESLADHCKFQRTSAPNLPRQPGERVPGEFQARGMPSSTVRVS